MRLVLLGPPGAGKGTIAGLIKEQYGIAHISTGDMLRAEMKSGSDLGSRVKQFVEKGGLVPDETITEILKNRLVQGGGLEAGFMLDGYPRTTAQAEDLDRILGTIGEPIEHVIYMEADLDVVLGRLTGRRVCRQCGALYHVKNKPPRTAGRCDECGGGLYQRPDDNEETIRRRMDVYAKSTEPIVGYYRAQGKLSTVDAGRDSNEVLNELKALFHEDGRPDQDQDARRD